MGKLGDSALIHVDSCGNFFVFQKSSTIVNRDSTDVGGKVSRAFLLYPEKVITAPNFGDSKNYNAQ